MKRRLRSAPDAVGAVPVRTGTGSYPVLVGLGLLERIPELLCEYAPGHRYALISDDHVASLYAESVVASCTDAGLDAGLFTFPQGEASKTRKQWSILTDALLDAGIRRDGVVVALGGGVTGDLGGFVAATYLRGIPVVQVPTSLVAMIDASVGGKTAVDVRAGKNLVGAFHPPRVVVADPLAIGTLPVHERAQGLAEAIKHGAILDSRYFDDLSEAADGLLAGDARATRAAVLRSVELKARVVTEDEHEEGFRQILNFGHTIGHAIEAASSYSVGHGMAIAAGMILEARLGERLGVTETGTSERLSRALSRFGMGAVPRLDVGIDEILGYMGVDKKARQGRARFVFLRSVGSVRGDDGWSSEAPPAEVSRVVEEALRGGA
ncbi:MAG: 3-dehydroquinate synthase [Gemmatimonadetes bacterium]|nr:3-dehydroquinate synthase [Gemmatimonadota bacterium]